MVSIRTLFLATRPQYLLLSALLVYLGAGLAGFCGSFQWPHTLLCLVGLLLLHASTNVLNDYFDYSSGIDLETQRTPFNGGSGLLTEGLLSGPQALWFGLGTFALAIPVGVYFVAEVGWLLLPLFLAGAAFVILGTSHITRLGYGLGELAAGLGLGALPVFGTAWIVHGAPASVFLYATVPSAIWVLNLLFLNEFPDEGPDRRGGRKTLVIQLGFGRAHGLFVSLSIAAFVWIAAGIAAGAIPVECLLAFVALPFAFKAINLSRQPDFAGDFVRAQAANVGLVLTAHFLLATGYVWAALG